MKKLVPLLALFLAACGSGEKANWLGYIEGEEALIAAPQPGWITSIAVTRGKEVKQGDLLFTLDDTNQQAASDNATAQMAAAHNAIQQARADATRTEKELKRQQELAKVGGAPQRDLETAQAAYQAARAKLQQELNSADAAAATVMSNDYNLEQRNVRSRVAGQVQDIYFRQGEYATSGTPVVAILPPSNVYVRFFVPEEELATIKVGEKVRITCDSCPQDLTAEIGFIAADAEFTPPVIYSVANRKKLVFKVEARTAGPLPLRPGLPVSVGPVAAK